jgi:hypothetical protein
MTGTAGDRSSNVPAPLVKICPDTSRSIVPAVQSEKPAICVVVSSFIFGCKITQFSRHTRKIF